MADDDATKFRPRAAPYDPAASAQGDGVVEAASPTIPSVELGQRLGEGGMAVVFEGLDRGFTPPRRVAVKLMSAALSSDPEFRARFEREASIVADFRHDNIVHIYASGEAGGEKFIVMEYLPGGTLATRIDAGRLDAGNAIRIAAQLADALAYSHARDIIHRDFKPGNVLFTGDGKPVLSDFGVAKSTSAEGAGLTQHAAVIGAPRYMAPEQDRGDPATDRADVYSWGLTLYEMLAGRPPTNRARVQYGGQEDGGLGEALDDTPLQVVTLIRRCLSFDPGQRPTARQCAETLDELTIARRAGAASDRGPGAASSTLRWIPWAAGGAALLAAIGTGVWLWLGSGAAPPAPEAPAASAGRQMAQPPAGPLRVPVSRDPAETRVIIDGQELIGATTTLAPGRHILVAVAPGFYGALQTLEVGRGGPQQPVDVALRRQELPSTAEHLRFLDLADATAISAADVDSMAEATLRTALFAKQLRAEGRTAELADLDARLRQLIEAGDGRAAVARFLIDSIAAGRFDVGRISAGLRKAAGDGDALASFYLALAQRDALGSSPSAIRRSSAEFRAYCRSLRAASEQGWSAVADDHLRRDGCPAG